MRPPATEVLQTDACFLGGIETRGVHRHSVDTLTTPVASSIWTDWLHPIRLYVRGAVVPDPEFWSLIRSLDGSVSPAGIDRLVITLATRGEASIFRFAEDLAEALYSLDTPPHAEQAVLDAEDDDDAPGSMSDDVFLYARCAVVAAGSAVWERVRSDPALLAGRWPLYDAEHLTTVAPLAYEQAVDGGAWDYETRVSYETGSNHDAWRSTSPPAGAEDAKAPWLEVGAGYDIGCGDRTTYSMVRDATVDLLRADPNWVRWWASSGRANLWLFPFYTRRTGTEPVVKLGRTTVKAEFNIDASVCDMDDRLYLSGRARTGLFEMLDVVRQRLQLPPAPAAPPPPALPKKLDLDAPDEFHPYEFDDGFTYDWTPDPAWADWPQELIE